MGFWSIDGFVCQLCRKLFSLVNVMKGKLLLIFILIASIAIPFFYKQYMIESFTLGNILGGNMLGGNMLGGNTPTNKQLESDILL